MKIVLANFMGEVPKVEPDYMPDNMAAMCREARLERGNLEPMRAHRVAETLADDDRQTIYLHNGQWIDRDDMLGDYDAVPGPVAQDRLYITRDSGPPRIFVQSESFWSDLALPRPDQPLTISANPSTPIVPTLKQTVLYAFTWVTEFGEESRPSPLSAQLVASPNQSIDINWLTSVAPAGRRINRVRIYRSQTTSTGVTDLFFVAERPHLPATWTHSLTTHPIGEVISTKDFDAPPPGLQGLTAMPNGMMVAFTGSEVWFSEPYQPHAWPAKYTLVVNDPVVGLVAFGTSVAVLTKGHPYVIQGLHPESMAMTRMEVDLPCVAKRGIVDLGYAAVYPSHAGLAQIGEAGAQLISEGIWTRDQWQRQIKPTTIAAAQYLSRYVFTYEPGPPGERHAAMLDLKGAMPFLVPMERYDYRYLHFDIRTGNLYGLVGAQIREIDPETGAAMTYEWRSRNFRFPVPVGFGVAKVIARPPAAPAVPFFELQVLANGNVHVTHNSPQGLLRIPQGKYEAWQVRLRSNYTITSVTMCGSIEELMA